MDPEGKSFDFAFAAQKQKMILPSPEGSQSDQVGSWVISVKGNSEAHWQWGNSSSC
jgi:hypothetical protein